MPTWRIASSHVTRAFRAICQNALEGLASKKLNLAMLVERRALPGSPRGPETIARSCARRPLCYPRPEPVAGLPHAFDPGRTPTTSGNTSGGRTGDSLPGRPVSPCSADRETARSTRWNGSRRAPLFEAVRATPPGWPQSLHDGAVYYSSHEQPARMDFFRPDRGWPG